MFYKILQDTKDLGKLTISKSFSEKNSFEETKYVTISFGLRKLEVNLEISHNVQESELLLSEDILKQLMIPLDIKYQVNCTKINITIGPVIGYLINKTDTRLTESIKFVKNQDTLSERPSSGFSRNTSIAYPGVQGLLYVFSSEGIDFRGNCVSGYYYSPNAINDSERWKKGTFPLPSAVHNRIFRFKHPNRRKLINLTGNKLFNSYWQNKWDFWKIASKSLSLKSYLPYTAIFDSFKTLDNMLMQFDTVYIKPINSLHGYGILKMSCFNGNYYIQQTFENIPVEFTNKNTAFSYLSTLLQKKWYLLQQGVDTLIYNDGCTIFRVIMQKDETLKWKCTGICPRVGNPQGICTNYAPESYVFSFESFLKETLKLEDNAIAQKKKELIDLCMNLSYLTDIPGENCGDLGIDIGLDKKQRFWVFEVNYHQLQSVPLRINDVKMYYNVKANLLRYATGLCGFNYYEDEVQVIKDENSKKV
jgi:hypothetical protein